MEKRIAVYPGTFDPITYGHIDIIKRGIRIFDKIIVAVANNMHKNPIFDVNERKDLIRDIISEKRIANVEVDSFDGLLVDYLKRKNVRIIVRGLRVVTDFDYEFVYSMMNKKLYDKIETVFLISSEKYSFISSTLIKEVTKYGGDISSYSPDRVIKKLKEKYREV